MSKYIERLTTLAYKNVSSLAKQEEQAATIDTNAWGEFKIGDLFNVSRPTSRPIKKYNDTGSIPYIGSGSDRNGVIKYSDPIDDESLDKKHCLTVSPVDGSCFYQPNDFLGRGGAGSSIIILRNNDFSTNTMLFIASTIRSHLSEKYSYSSMGNVESVAHEIVKLPITSEGQLDGQYMDIYIEKLKQKAQYKLIAYK